MHTSRITHLRTPGLSPGCRMQLRRLILRYLSLRQRIHIRSVSAQGCILHLPKDAESPVCSGLLLLSSNWSNSNLGNFIYNDSRCNRYKILSNSIPANMIAKLRCFAFQPQVLVHNTLALLMTRSTRAPTYHRARQFSRTPWERNVSHSQTAFMLPWKSWPNKYFASSFPRKKKKQEPEFMHDASCIVSPMHFFPSVRLPCSHNFQHPE